MDGSGTVGALDMGGASTQITFVSSNHAQKSVEITLYGEKYPVFTHSFLCYGMKEAQRRFLAQLVKVKLREAFTQWVPASNFSIQYLYLIKHTGNENKGDDQQR